MRTLLVIPAAFALMSLAHVGEKPAKEHSQALSEGDRIIIGGRGYAPQFFKKGGLVGRVEKRGAFCLWKDGTAWVIDPLHPDLKDHFAFPWPIESLSADRSLAIVRVPAKKDLLAVADVRQKTLIAEAPPEAEAKFFNFDPGEWVFSKKSQHVYALHGLGLGGWYYFDLVQKKRIAVEVPGFQPRFGAHLWNGALLDDGKEAVIFLTGADKRDGRRRVQFPLDQVEKRAVAVPDIDVLSVLEIHKDQLTACLGDGKYGLVSTQTWKVLKRFDWAEKIGSPLYMQVGPGGRHAYINDGQRVVVYQRRTGNFVKVLLDAKDGFVRSLGVTFTADGRQGVIAAGVIPAAGSQIAVFDTDRHEIVGQFALKHDAFMAFFIEPAKNETVGTCLVLD